MKLEIRVNVFQPCRNVMLRLVLNAVDNTPVAMATTIVPFSADEGNICVRMQLLGLAPGKYKIKPALYLINDYGAEQHLDVIVDAAVFMVQQKKEGTRLAWNKRYWGYLQLPDLVIENVEKHHQENM